MFKKPSKTAQVRKDKLKAYVRSWFQLLRITSHKLEVLNTFLAALSARSDIDDSPAAGSAGLLAHTLLFDIIKDLVGLILDDDERAPSLMNIQEVIRDEGVQQALKQEALAPRSGYSVMGDLAQQELDALAAQLADSDRLNDEAEFDASVPRVLRRLQDLLGIEVLKRMATARDKTIAHFEMVYREGVRNLYKIDDLGLKWSDPQDVVIELESFGHDLVLLVLGYSIEFGELRRKDRQNAEMLWHTLT